MSVWWTRSFMRLGDIYIFTWFYDLKLFSIQSNSSLRILALDATYTWFQCHLNIMLKKLRCRVQSVLLFCLCLLLKNFYICLQEDGEDVGDLYQDEENGAALLIRRHPKHGKLVVVSHITSSIRYNLQWHMFRYVEANVFFDCIFFRSACLKKPVQALRQKIKFGEWIFDFVFLHEMIRRRKVWIYSTYIYIYLEKNLTPCLRDQKLQK